MTPQQIIDRVCYALSISDIKANTRRAEYSHARFIAILAIRLHSKASYHEIAALIGRDLTTVYSGETRAYNLMKMNHEAFLNAINKVLQLTNISCV